MLLRGAVRQAGRRGRANDAAQADSESNDVDGVVTRIVEPCRRPGHCSPKAAGVTAQPEAELGRRRR